MTDKAGNSLDHYLELLSEFETEATRAIGDAADDAALESARIRYLGRESDWRKKLSVGTLVPDARREGGQRYNEAMKKVEELHAARKSAVTAARGRRPAADTDLSMPARRQWIGAKHPVTLVIEEIEAIFRELGFTIALGPEAETEWYNFGALNFPADHPAMDAHDTLYLNDEVVLRTHTSPVQVRTLQKFAPPVRVLVPGNVYRRDFFDPSHAPMFAQIEGLSIDEGVSFVDLKATLTRFAERFYGARPTRFRPSFFPFTEPSAEMDVQCGTCGGSGCPVCKGTGWVEILGSGMVHPHVLENAGVDPERYSGWAFGMGPARIAVSRYGLPDIRLLYDSDMRFLEQLARPVMGAQS